MAEQVYSILKDEIIVGFNSIYKNVLLQNQNKQFLFRELQQQLKMIPKWTKNMVQKEVQRIIVSTKCQFLEDIIQDQLVQMYKERNFVSQEQRLTIKNLQLIYVIYGIYMRVAKYIYKKPQIMYHNFTEEQKQLCLNELSNIIYASIEELMLEHIEDNNNIHLENTMEQESESENESIEEQQQKSDSEEDYIEEVEPVQYNDNIDDNVIEQESLDLQLEQEQNGLDLDLEQVDEQQRDLELELELGDQEPEQEFEFQTQSNPEPESELDDLELDLELEDDKEEEVKTINIVLNKPKQQEEIKSIKIAETKEEVFENNNKSVSDTEPEPEIKMDVPEDMLDNIENEDQKSEGDFEAVDTMEFQENLNKLIENMQNGFGSI